MRDARGGNCDKGDAENSSSLFLYISLIVFSSILFQNAIFSEYFIGSKVVKPFSRPIIDEPHDLI